jgi:hypothetical protein
VGVLTVLYPDLFQGPPLADAPDPPALLVDFSDFFILVYLSTVAVRSLSSPFYLLASTNAATVGLVSRSTSSRYSPSARTLLAWTRSFLALPPISREDLLDRHQRLDASPEVAPQDLFVSRVPQPADRPLVIGVPVTPAAARLPHPLILLPLIGLTHVEDLPRRFKGKRPWTRRVGLWGAALSSSLTFTTVSWS